MRTYYLAADSYEIMNDWVEAIKMACMLQTNVGSERHSGPSVSSMYNASIDNSDSGFHQQYLNVHPPHTYPKHPQPQSHTPPNYISNIQPLYANAPPKPRRQTDGVYSMHGQEYPHELYSTPSSSTNTPGYQNPLTPLQYNPIAVQHCCSRSPVSTIYRNCDNVPLPQYVNHNHHQGQSVYPIYYTQYPHVNNGIQNSERRTPDTYGRSKLSSGKSKDASDYEDIYADEVMYKRPLSPIAYSNIKKISPVSTIPVLPVHRPYTLFNVPGPQRPHNFVEVCIISLIYINH